MEGNFNLAGRLDATHRLVRRVQSRIQPSASAWDPRLLRHMHLGEPVNQSVQSSAECIEYSEAKAQSEGLDLSPRSKSDVAALPRFSTAIGGRGDRECRFWNDVTWRGGYLLGGPRVSSEFGLCVTPACCGPSSSSSSLQSSIRTVLTMHDVSVVVYPSRGGLARVSIHLVDELSTGLIGTLPWRREESLTWR